MNTPIGDMQEVQLLRLLVAALVGTDPTTGAPTFSFPFRSANPPVSGIGGTTGTVDNAITTASGTGGSTLQGTVVTIAPTTGTFAFNTDTGQLQFGVSKDAVLSRGGPDILEQKRGTNAQALNIYNTFTDPSNYTRIVLHWISQNQFEILAQEAGTGSNASIILQSNYGAKIEVADNIRISNGPIIFTTDNAWDIGASGATRPRTIYAATSVLAPNIPVVDTGWTANADNGDKTAVIPTNANVATIGLALDILSSGAGSLLVAVADKLKALEGALVAIKLPNA